MENGQHHEGDAADQDQATDGSGGDRRPPLPPFFYEACPLCEAMLCQVCDGCTSAWEPGMERDDYCCDCCGALVCCDCRLASGICLMCFRNCPFWSNEEACPARRHSCECLVCRDRTLKFFEVVFLKEAGPFDVEAALENMPSFDVPASEDEISEPRKFANAHLFDEKTGAAKGLPAVCIRCAARETLRPEADFEGFRSRVYNGSLGEFSSLQLTKRARQTAVFGERVATEC